jgi:hypothetical protein
MKRLILAVLIVGVVSPAWGEAKGVFQAIITAECSEILSDYATSKLESRGGNTTYNKHFGDIIGWIAGYMTRVNYSIPGKENYFHDLIDEVAWVASWCRDNSSSDLTAAMKALTRVRTGGR